MEACCLQTHICSGDQLCFASAVCCWFCLQLQNVGKSYQKSWSYNSSHSAFAEFVSVLWYVDVARKTLDGWINQFTFFEVVSFSPLSFPVFNSKLS